MSQRLFLGGKCFFRSPPSLPAPPGFSLESNENSLLSLLAPASGGEEEESWPQVPGPTFLKLK